MDQYSYKNNYGYNDVRERDFRVPPPPRPAYYNQNYTEQPPSYHREFLLPPSLPCVMPYFNKHVPPPNIQPPFIPPPAPVSYYKPAPISRFSSNNYTLPYENTNINKTPVHIDNTRSRNPELSRNLLLPSTSRPSKTEDRGYRRDDPDSHYRHESTDSRYRHENTDSRYRHNNSDSSYRNDSSDSHYRRTRDSYSRSSSRPDDRYRRSRSRTSYRPEERRPRRSESKGKPESERDALLSNWRKNYCTTSEDISEKMKKLANKDDREKDIVRSTPAEKYYEREISNARIVKATGALTSLCNRFENHLLSRAQKVRDSKPLYEPPPRKNRARLCKHKTEKSDSSDSSSEEYLTDEEDCTMEELERKQKHPDRLHLEMWFNDPGEMNDGPLCRCSLKAQKSGIRHGIYAGEKSLKKCDVNSNNADRLYHYRITISPPTNFLTKTPTIIHHDDHEFIFEGFSMFSHFALEKLPTCKVIRFNIEYTILYYEEKSPDKFCIKELDFFHDYLFREVLELLDFNLKAVGDSQGCSQFHFMPRFVRDIEDGKEILSMCEVLKYLIDNSYRLIEKDFLTEMVRMSQHDWQNFADEVKGMVVTYPGKKPCSVRVDQLDRNLDKQTGKEKVFPEIVHFGIRPPQLSYAGNPDYQKAWRDYVKFRHLLANMPKPSFEDKRKLEAKEAKLQDMRTASKLKRDVTVAVSAEGFHRTGIMCDIVQHAMLIPVLVCHLRFHHSLDVLEENISYKFKNRYLLQLALTHPSYRENFGTNPDHARNSLTNCGIRQPEYGDRRIHYMNTRKRGINTLINIMSRFGKKDETESNITHNERLEFLGDAVVEFLTSIHLFFLFPDLEEGGLATYRAALVQNQHLAVLARKLCLDQFMLYAHGSDLCHDLELRHAMANCFEALMGALFLDGGIEVADKVFGQTLFKDESQLLEIWFTLPLHPLQEQEPDGDRHHVTNVKVLQKLSKFEDSIGVEFKHIRLLARAFTDRSIGYTNLTLGSNQRLEFLGDTVLQLISSEYLYKHFPEHHEGHLSLLRSSLVNNRTQAVVCNDLDLTSYAMYNNPKAELKTKDRADLLEALLGALYVDKGMDFCSTFCNVTLFPRLQTFIMNQDWNDPKSKLQQCCLTLRTMEGGEPDIPIYKVIECKGPTNTRVYTVAVYFRGKRLEKATGHSIQQAEMNAARQALEKSQDLFPQLDHQKRVIAKSMKKQKKQRGKGYCPATNINNQKSEPKSQPENTLPESYRQQNDLVTQARDSRNSKSNKRRRSYSKSPDRYTKSNYEYDINQPHCSKYLPKCSYENKKYPETSSSKQSYTKSSYDSNIKKEDRVLINDFNEAECRKQNRLGIEIISDEYLGRYSDDNMGIIMPQDIKPNYNYADAADHKIVIFDLKDAMILKDARL